MLERAVGDDGDLRAARDEVAGRRLAHLPGAEQQHAAAGELAEDLLRERGRGRRDRGRALADRGLDAHLPADVQRLAEEPVEQRPGRAGLEGGAHLAEDLALAGHERVEPGGDAEEVERRRLVVQPVERGRELVGAIARDARQRCDGLFVGVLLAHEVELGAVARGEHDRLGAELGGQPPARVAVERDALPQLDRSAVVRDADERQLHRAKWVSGRTSATSAKPARVRSAARRPRQPSCRRTSRDAYGAQIPIVTTIAASRSSRWNRDAPTPIPSVSRASETSTLRAASRSSASSGGTRTRRTRALVPLQAPLLPEVERRQPGGERQAGEARQHETDVDGEHGAGVLALVEPSAPAGPGEDQERGRDRHHGETEQAVARRAAPDQVRADDEPDEEVERAGPRSPREAVRRRRLAGEQRRLGEPAEPHAPGREPTGETRTAKLTGVGEGGLAVGEERRHEEQLSHEGRVPGELRELGDLPLEARELRRDDRDVDEHGHEHDAVGGRDVLLARAHAVSISRSSRRFESSRLPSELEPVERVREHGHREPGDAEREEHRPASSAARRG